MINIQRNCSQYFRDVGNVGENFGDEGDICAGASNSETQDQKTYTLHKIKRGKCDG